MKNVHDYLDRIGIASALCLVLNDTGGLIQGALQSLPPIDSDACIMIKNENNTTTSSLYISSTLGSCQYIRIYIYAIR